MNLARIELLLITFIVYHLVSNSPACAGFANGDFETGDLTGWTTELLFNGTVGGSGFPGVESFDTISGETSEAAVFKVGKVNSAFWGIPSGGGIYQNLFLTEGSYRVTADYASFNSSALINEEAGRFGLSVDGGNYIPEDLNRIYPSSAIHGHMDVEVTIAATGIHKFTFLVFRDGTISADTPQQYLDNVQIWSLVPEPSLWALLTGASVYFLSCLSRVRE